MTDMADDLQSIKRDIDIFKENPQTFKLTVTSPGKRLSGAIRFGASTN